ncbi:hypothetical protein Tco_1245635 [Tanacetum coccineum]
MGELTFFLGLQVKQQPDGIFISQDKYVADILKSNKLLIKDEDGEDVDVHVYRSMIGSLMYLIASRPDIMFAVYAYARFQVTLKASHLNAVKWIFSDYGGASLDKNQQQVAVNFLNQMMDYGFNIMNTRIHIDNECTISFIKNPVAHLRTKHVEIQFHFIRDFYEKRLIEVIKIHTDSNVVDLLTKGFDVTRFNFLVVVLFMVKKGKKNSGNVTPLFLSMLAQPTEDEDQECLHEEKIGKEEVFEDKVDAEGLYNHGRLRMIHDEGASEGTVSQMKQKGFEIKEIKDTDRPRNTTERSILTLKPLPKIDPKNKGKKVFEEKVESDADSEGVNEPEKKFKMLANDEEIAKKVQEE